MNTTRLRIMLYSGGTPAGVPETRGSAGIGRQAWLRTTCRKALRLRIIVTEFKVGDILKFSQEGLEIWCSTAPDNPRRQWRWEVVEVSSPSIFLKRVDRQSQDRDWWSPDFFEKVVEK